jgi:hypothetical protein
MKLYAEARRGTRGSTQCQTGIPLFLYGLLVFLCYPWLLLHGRLWGEEGPVYFRAAWSGGTIAALVAPHLGYLAVWPNICALIAARCFPLPFAALAVTWGAFLVQMLAGYLVLRCELFATLKSKNLALALLLVAGNYEVWLNSINSQFYLVVCMAVIFLSRPEQLRIRRNLVLLLAGLTGPVAVSLAPFFLLRALLLKSKAAAAQAGVLCACAVLQARIMMLSIGHGGRVIQFRPKALAPVYLVRYIIGPFLSRVAEKLGASLILAHAPFAWPVLLVSVLFDLIFIGFLFYVTADKKDRSTWWLLSLGLWLFLICMYGALGGSDSPRYVFPSTVLTGFSLVLAAVKRDISSVRRTAAVLLLSGLFLAGTLNYGHYRFWAARERVGEQTWEMQAERWEQNPTVKLPVWPKGWLCAGFSLPPTHH